MKRLAFYLILLTSLVQAQELEINLDSGVLNQEIIVERGKYGLSLVNKTKIQILEFKMSRESGEYQILSIPEVSPNSAVDTIQGLLDPKTKNKLVLKFSDNTIYTFVLKVKVDTEVQERRFLFESQSTWDWSSTFGVNAIFLFNSDTYKTVADGDEFQIIGDSGQDIIEYLPSIMFTFMDKSKNISTGFSAGLGFDLEQISVFVGPSIGIGQNFVVTGGVAFHNQQRLDSRYRVNDNVDSSLNFDDLHERYYRFNPFLSLSFRLDKSPFKSGDD